MPQAKQMGAVMLEHDKAMACWGSPLDAAQRRCQELQADQKVQEASLAAQDAELCSALQAASSQAARSMQEGMQALRSLHELWTSR